jgi:hypothetical protein
LSQAREEAFERFEDYCDDNDDIDWEVTHEADDDTDRIGLHVNDGCAELDVSITASGDFELTFDEEDDLTDNQKNLWEDLLNL